MLNTIIKLISLLLFSLILSGCGGSGGGDAQENAELQLEQAEAVTTTMDSLVAAEDFSFTSKKQIQVILELNDYQDQRAFVSVYREYQLLDSGRYYPDSASRVISGQLQSGIFNESFTALDNQQEYLIEVWFYDGREPLQKELSVNNNQLIWQ